MAENMTRVPEPDDPRRCQGITSNGQCLMVAEPGKDYCRLHGGRVAVISNQLRAYRLERWQARMVEFAEHPQAKSLKEEIGITRLMVEEIIAKCHTSTDLILYSTKISSLIGQLQTLVVAAQKLDERTGSVLDKSTIIQLCQGIMEAIESEVTDHNVLERIAERIQVSINNSAILAKTKLNDD